MYLQSHSIDASQCSEAVCEALFADMEPLVFRLVGLHAELSVVSLKLSYYSYNCNTNNVDCDKIEELVNKKNQINQEMKEVDEEMQELAPYWDLCFFWSETSHRTAMNIISNYEYLYTRILHFGI